MPMYDYECPNCRWIGELFQVAYGERGSQTCPECKDALGSPVIKKAPALHGPGYQMQALLGNGDHIKGHFGKEAKRGRKRSG